MNTNVSAAATPIKSASTEFARDVFAWQEQIHTDRATIPNAKPISAFDFRLAYAITQYTNKYSRKAWPFQERLAADLGVDVRTVGRGIANLVKRGHLSVTRRGRDESAIYQMIIQDQTPMSGHDEVRPDTGVRSNVARPDTGVTKTRHPCPREPLREPLKKESLSTREGESRSSGRRQSQTPCPEAPSSTMIEYAHEKVGWNSTRSATEFENFRDYHLKKGNRFEDWPAAWRTWVRKGAAYDQERAQRQGHTIDQDGNPVAPPPSQQRSPPSYRESTTERMMRKMGGGNG